MNKLCKIVIAIAFIGLSEQAGAQNTIIPDISESYLNRLLETAKTNYPRIRTFAHRVGAAKENLSRVKASYFNSFNFSYVYQPNSTINLYQQPSSTTPTTTTNQQSFFRGMQLGVFFNLGSFLQTPAAVRQAKQDLNVTISEQEEYAFNLAALVKKRYYVYLQRVGQLRLLSAGVTDAENMLQDVRARFEKGEDSLDNYNKARVNYTQQVNTKLVAEGDLFVAKSELEELLGDKLENVK